MKTKILFIGFTIFIISCLIVRAEDNPINRLFEKYSGKEGFTSVHISKFMFELIKTFSKEENNSKEGFRFQDIVKGLDGMNILNYSPERTEHNKKFDFYNEIIKDIPLENYQSLMDVNQAESKAKFLIKKDNKGNVSEFLMIVDKDDGGTLIWVYGDLDLNNIKKLSKDMNIKGLEELEKNKEK